MCDICNEQYKAKCKCQCKNMVAGDTRWFAGYYISAGIDGRPRCIKCGCHLIISKLPEDWKKSYENGYGVKLEIKDERIIVTR